MNIDFRFAIGPNLIAEKLGDLPKKTPKSMEKSDLDFSETFIAQMEDNESSVEIPVNAIGHAKIATLENLSEQVTTKDPTGFAANPSLPVILKFKPIIQSKSGTFAGIAPALPDDIEKHPPRASLQASPDPKQNLKLGERSLQNGILQYSDRVSANIYETTGGDTSINTTLKREPVTISISNFDHIDNKLEKSNSVQSPRIAVTPGSTNVEIITSNIIKLATLHLSNIGAVGAISQPPTQEIPTSQLPGIIPGHKPIQNLQIQLQPHNLGVIEVKLQNVGGRISIEIETTNIQAETILRTQLGALGKTLEFAGFALEELKILHNPNAEIVNSNASQQTNQSLSRGDNFSQTGRNFTSNHTQNSSSTSKNSIEDTLDKPYREGIYL